jgi:hypothetical protein
MASINLGNGYYFFYDLPLEEDIYGNQGIFYTGEPKQISKVTQTVTAGRTPGGAIGTSFIFTNNAETAGGGAYVSGWSIPGNLSISIKYNGSTVPPTGTAGASTTVNVVATMTTPVAKSASFSFVIQPASPQPISIVASAAYTFTKDFDGFAFNASGNFSSNSDGAVSISYKGNNATTYGPSATPPTVAGDYLVTYSVAATPLFVAGSLTKSLKINKISSYIAFKPNANFSYYNGSARPMTFTVIPTMAYTVLYNGSETVPTNIGTYQITARVIDPSFTPTAQSIYNGTYSIVRTNQLPSTAANSTTIVRATYSKAINKFLVDFVGTYQ